jgi:hypothetical protein
MKGLAVSMQLKLIDRSESLSVFCGERRAAGMVQGTVDFRDERERFSRERTIIR